METLIENKTKKYTSHDANDLYDAVLETEDAINHFVEFNEFKLNNPFIVPRVELKNALGELTLNQRKKLKKAMNIFHAKNSICSANRFLHFLYSRVFKIDTRIRIGYNSKQLAIQNKRKAYLKLRTEMEAALYGYKEEKGNYYKLRLAKGQKLQ